MAACPEDMAACPEDMAACPEDMAAAPSPIGVVHSLALGLRACPEDMAEALTATARNSAAVQRSLGPRHQRRLVRPEA